MSELKQLPIAKIKSEGNVRRNLGDLTELTASVKSVGILEPVFVRPNGDGWILVFGHRRLAAAKAAGMKQVPAIVRSDLNDAELVSAQLVENLMRKDIDPLEEADGYRRLLDLGLKQTEVAKKVGRSEAHVSKRLSLLDLPKAVHELVLGGKLSMADALELTPYVKDAEVIEETLKQLRESIRNGWGFRVSDHARGAARRIEQRRKREAAVERLKAAKVSVLGHDAGYGAPPKGTYALGKGYAELPLTPLEHAKSPCHAAFVRSDGEVVYVCTKLENHKDSKDKAVIKALADIKRYRGYDSPSHGDGKAAKEQAKKAAASRERNKVLREREPIRSAELVRVLSAKQKREAVVDFVLRQLLQRFLDESHEVEELAASLLEVPFKPTKHSYERAKVDWPTWLAGGKDRVFKLAYAIALASGEHPFRHLLKQGYFDGEYVVNAGRYIEHLRANGYQPDKQEVAQLGKPANAYQWRAPFDEAKKK